MLQSSSPMMMYSPFCSLDGKRGKKTGENPICLVTTVGPTDFKTLKYLLLSGILNASKKKLLANLKQKTT